MSTINQVLLVPPTAMTGTDAAYYTVPSATTVKIGRAIFCNTDSSAHTLTINVNTGTSSAANEIIAAVGIASGSTYVSPELAGMVLPPGYQIRGLSATQVTMTVSGITIVG
jgi:hypothetical protein